MSHIRFTVLLLFIIGVLTATLQAQQNASRTTYNFNYNWKVKVTEDEKAQSIEYSDKDWKKVSLPHAWNEDEAFKKDIKNLSTGIAWYRKHFKIPATHQGHKVFIEFEGVRQAAEVYVNGEFAGLHETASRLLALIFRTKSALVKKKISSL